MAEPVVTAHLNLSAISDKGIRDILRQAAAETRHGPVRVTRDGKRIAALVSVELAEFAVAAAEQPVFACGCGVPLRPGRTYDCGVR
jgi:hypothetical protein